MPTSWVDQVLAKLAELKASVSILHNELLELIGSQLKMDQLLRQEAVTHVMSKAEQKRGLEGILLAMSFVMVSFGSDAAPQCSCRDRQWHDRPFGNSGVRHDQASCRIHDRG